MYSYNGGCEQVLLRNWDSTIPSFALTGKYVKNGTISELEGLLLTYDGAEYEVSKNGILIKDGVRKSNMFNDGRVSCLNLAGGSVVSNM